MRNPWLVTGILLVSVPSTQLDAQEPTLRLALTADSAVALPIRVTTGQPGQLLLLRVEGNDVRVLYPAKPGATSFLASGDYDLRSMGANRGASRLWGNPGKISVVAIWSPEPLNLNKLVRYGHWAVSDLDGDQFQAAPAAAAKELARQLEGGDALQVASLNVPGYAPGPTMGRVDPWFNRDPIAEASRETWRQLSRECPAGSARENGGGEVCTVNLDRP